MPSGSNFIFVNKDAKSARLTQSCGLERSRIFSHVQQLYPDKADLSNIESWHVFQSPKGWKSKKDARSGSRISLHSKPKHWAYNGTDNIQNEEAERTSFQLTQRSAVPLTKTIGVVGDPFNSHKVPFTPKVHYLFGVYSNDIMPLLCPVKSIALPSQDYTLNLILEDPLMHHALLSSVSTKMYSCTGNNLHHIDAIASKQQALAFLRSSMSDPGQQQVNVDLCYSISVLIWIECLLGNLDDLKVHASALQWLIPRIDDISAIPVYILRIIYACLCLCTALLDVPPPPQPTWPFDESQLSAEAKSIIQDSKMIGSQVKDRSFFSIQDWTQLGPSLTSIIADCERVFLVRNHTAAKQRELSHPDVRYVCFKEASVEHDLLAFRFDASLGPFQHAIRLALFINSSLPIIAATGSSAALSRTLAKRIRQNIERADECANLPSSSELVLWVLIMGAFISKGEEDWPWFKARIHLLLHELQIESFGDLKARLQGYFWTGYIEGSVRAIWQEYES